MNLRSKKIIIAGFGVGILIVGLLLNGKMVLSLTISLILIIVPLLLILFKERIEIDPVHLDHQ